MGCSCSRQAVDPITLIINAWSEALDKIMKIVNMVQNGNPINTKQLNVMHEFYNETHNEKLGIDFLDVKLKQINDLIKQSIIDDKKYILDESAKWPATI
jgi:hypothetical protein